MARIDDEKPPQSYDSSLKELVQQQAPDILPLSMRNVDHTMMQQVMEELAQLYRHDEVTLVQQFVWMELLLARTDTVPVEEKEKIRRGLKMYDRLWDENPKVQQIRTESKAEGRVEGRAEGRVQGELLTLRRLLVSVVNARFPSLVELAQEAGQIENAGTLDILVQQVATAPDENTVRRLLSVPRA